MCGIAGFQGGFPAGLLDGMSAAVAHRGPDDAGTVLLERGRTPVGLAHRRLAIIDLSCEGRQPMTVRCPRCRSTGLDDLALSYNGEIYNFPELRAELEGAGHVFHSGTDSEVLLHLYGEHGTRMLERLNGMFAFALVDGREEPAAGVQPGDVFLARDPLGVKPLYYSATPAGLLFASELKALLCSPDVSREIDPAAVHFHLAYLWAPAPYTLLRHVRKLRPGEAMVARGGRVERTWTFYDLPYGRDPLGGGEAELAGELRERLGAAVRRQMVADVPVGAFLSGGLDSSAVVAMMRRAEPDREIRCFTIGFPEGHDEEGKPADLPYARKVAAHLGVGLDTLHVEEDAFELLERMLYHLDEPQADPAPINALLIAERAREAGIPVLLSGAGGDDLFSGYRRHRALALDAVLGRLPAPVARAAGAVGQAISAAAPAGLMRRPWAWRAARMLAGAGRGPELRTVGYFWWNEAPLRAELVAPELAAMLPPDFDAATPLLESLERIPGERDPLNRMLYLEARHFLADHNLNYTDKMAMAAGVEVRVPFLDLELVDFATRLPTRLKQRGRTGKYLLKKAMEPILPPEVIYRPKTGFSMPLRQWVRGELRPRILETLSPSAVARRGLFDPAAVQRLIEDNESGRVDGAYTIFALLCMETWCRLFLDPAPAAQLMGGPSVDCREGGRVVL
jgi:asparagine synthase (glutamine-hydrolysing)